MRLRFIFILILCVLVGIAQGAESIRKVATWNMKWLDDTLSDHFPAVLCVDVQRSDESLELTE